MTQVKSKVLVLKKSEEAKTRVDLNDVLEVKERLESKGWLLDAVRHLSEQTDLQQEATTEFK